VDIAPFAHLNNVFVKASALDLLQATINSDSTTFAGYVIVLVFGHNQIPA
jgi:hypothetical protein